MDERTKDRLHYQIDVMQAALQGRPIERRLDGSMDHWDIDSSGVFNWAFFDYRVRVVATYGLRCRYDDSGVYNDTPWDFNTYEEAVQFGNALKTPTNSNVKEFSVTVRFKKHGT
jgi:hypothetical protein